MKLGTTENGAGDGDRTRDIQLGRLTLCQLSYSRTVSAITAEMHVDDTTHGCAGL
jgi:hypothetical protein